MKHATKTIIYDYDGVLVDTFDISVAIHRTQYGKQVTPDTFRILMDKNIYEGLAQGLSPEELETKIDEFFHTYHPQVIGLGLIPGIDLVLKTIGEQHIPQHIISSSSERTIVEQLKQANMASYIHEVLGTETDRSKVVKFKYILSTYDLDPTQILFVTDTTGDIREAQSLGIPTIAVTWGYHERERLASLSPTYLVETPGELLHTLTTWV